MGSYKSSEEADFKESVSHAVIRSSKMGPEN